MSVAMRSRTASRESRRSRTISLDDSDLDPQIRVELEKLNSTSEEINKLEKQLDDLRQTFNQTLKESTKQLTQMARQNKRSIRKALDFHEASDIANKALKEAQEAAYKYHNAVDIYNAATETISRAEAATFDGGKRREFDSALQELLNHATMMLGDAEEERRLSKIHHDEKAHAYRTAQERVDFLAKKFKSSIAKTRCYYETKASLHTSLEGIKSEVSRVSEQLSGAKRRYRDALRHLESISEAMHEQRGVEISLEAQRRGIGVGAEDYREDLEIKLDLPNDDDAISEEGSLDSDPVLSSISEERKPSSTTLSRTVSGCSDRANFSDASPAWSSNQGASKVDSEPKLPELRESGDGLSPKLSAPPEKPFDDIDLGGLSSEARTTVGDSIPHKKTDSLERSEESGFGDEASSEGSEINMDDLCEEEDSLPGVPEPVAPPKRRVLKKLIPDKDEIWL